MPRDSSSDAQSPNSTDTQKSPDGKETKRNEIEKEDDFETIEHHETEAPASAPEGRIPGISNDDLKLQRFANSLDDTEEIIREEDDDDEDDSDDDEHAMASHPIFGMLAGRLGQRRRGSTHKYDSLHPENQVLTVANVDDCVEVEEAFPANERCSREKVSRIQPQLSATARKFLFAPDFQPCVSCICFGSNKVKCPSED